ncbi:MAG: hypothetical protein HOQ07_11920 [Sinomonas sp.]|nr:hypothetical protein [Sinomonas sp.]
MSTNPVLGGLATDLDRTDIQLALELVSLEEQAEAILARINGIKSELAERHPEKGDYPAGDYRIRVTVAQRKDTAAIARDYPAARYPDLYKPAIDTKSVDAYAQLGKIDLTQYLVSGSPSVKVI